MKRTGPRQAALWGGVLALVWAMAMGCACADEAVLRVCLNEHAPPYSTAQGDASAGFDVALAKELARRLNRRLEIQWFENKFDEDASAMLEADALLSDRRCDLLADYALIDDVLGQPGIKSTHLPDYRGAQPIDHRRRVELRALVASRPYLRAPLALVLAPDTHVTAVTAIRDVGNLQFGVVGGTFGDAILMLYDNGRLIDRTVHFAPNQGELLDHLEAHEFDATLVPLHHWDAYRGAHPQTRIRDSGFRYPLAFNLGYVALSDNRELLNQVDAVLESMQTSGRLEVLAREAGLTFVAPTEPAIAHSLTFSQLRD